MAKTRITDENQRSRIRVSNKWTKSVRIFFSFFCSYRSAAIQSEKLTSCLAFWPRFFSMPSYLDHVRSNNHARLFSYPRPYIYTYVNIHICRYRIYVATPVPQRVKSTFYFDEPSGYDTRSRRYPLVVQLFFFFSFSIRTCFDIPLPPELLLFSSPRLPARIRPLVRMEILEKFLRRKSRGKIRTNRGNKNRNLYTFHNKKVSPRVSERKYIWSALLKQ